MKTSNDVTNIFKAHIEMQSDLRTIGKDSKGYGYKYASFDSIVEYLRPILSKHNLGFIQSSTNESERIGVTTRLIHTSGEWVEDTFTVPLVGLAKMNDYQVAGSAITYLKRYGLSAIIGIASDEDADAQGEQVKQVEFKPCTEPQLKIINDLIVSKGVDIEKFKTAYKVFELNELSFEQAKDAITKLTKK